jgi:hypothetical protein
MGAKIGTLRRRKSSSKSRPASKLQGGSKPNPKMGRGKTATGRKTGIVRARDRK